MDENYAKDEAEFLAATAKLHGITLPSNKITAMYALLYEAARRAPNDEDLFIAAAREVFGATRGA